MKIGIVGGGPRVLWAVEELVSRAKQLPSAVEIDVWEPSDQVGAGRVYRWDQPALWRMNLRADRIETALGSYGRWREAQLQRGVELDRGFFPPRREVGRFLAESWDVLVSQAPDNIRITHRQARVTSIDERGGVAAGEVFERYDELLIATGHAQHWPGQLDDARVYADLSSIPARARVGVRGSALTFIDAVLELTLGRGGRLKTGAQEEDSAGSGDHPSRHGPRPRLNYRYVPSGREPVVVPVNRSGRFMQVKPAPGSSLDTHGRHEDLEHLLGPCREQVVHSADLAELKSALAAAALHLWEVFRAEHEDPAVELRPLSAHEDAATPPPRESATATRPQTRAATTGGGAAPSDADAAAVWTVINGTDVPSDPVAELRESIDVAAGVRAPHAAWAVGEAWRSLYPEIVARASFSGRDTLPGFGQLAHTLERVAFGPPLETAVPLLAIIDAGLICTEGLGKPSLLSPDSPDSQQWDGVWDATIAPPGVQPGSLCAQLVERGVARVRCAPDQAVSGASCGVDVHADGTLPGHENLAVVGRDAEGTVLGLDTLSRQLHRTIPLWADAVVARHCR